MISFKESQDSALSQDQDFTVLVEQTKQLYGALPKAVVVTVINSIILAVVLWPVVDHVILTIWITFILFISFLRAISTYRFNAVSPPPFKMKKWAQLFLVGSTLVSIAWGSTSIFLFPATDLVRQLFLAFVVAGMAAGAITTLSYLQATIYAFLVITLLPLMLRFVFSDNELSLFMGSMVILFLIVLLQSAKQSFLQNQQNIIMRIKNIKQEKSLAQSEHRYERLINTASDAFFLHNVEGKLIDVNSQACASLGYSKNELLRKSMLEIEEDPKSGKLISIWVNLKEDENIRYESVHRHKDGSTFPVEVSLGLIRMGEQSLLSVFARDVTERARVDKLKSEFISTVSHELRTPLTAIKGSIGLLAGGTVGELSNQMKEMLMVAGNNTDRLLVIINDILDIQKIESSDGLEMEFEKLDIIPLIKQSLEDNRSYADQYGVKYNFVGVNKTELHVFGNCARLMQVMANLLSNAAKFSNANENVEISVKPYENDKLKISIVDHGQGVSLAFQSVIFHKFTQQDSSDTRSKGGSGLGLNISKAIIEKHNGELNFTSNEEKGSTFYFTLPVYTPA